MRKRLLTALVAFVLLAGARFVAGANGGGSTAALDPGTGLQSVFQTGQGAVIAADRLARDCTDVTGALAAQRRIEGLKEENRIRLLELQQKRALETGRNKLEAEIQDELRQARTAAARE